MRNPGKKSGDAGKKLFCFEGDAMELYVHIPFCIRKCEYCSFVSFPAMDEQKDTYLDAVLREAEIRRREITEPFETVYIGGGTPSLLSPSQLIRLVNGLWSCLSLDSVKEFTVEANPGTITESFMETVSALRINRLSLGMQAYQDDLLQTLGRIHTFAAVEESVSIARKYGLHNLNLDLIFGIPGQSFRDWEETLDAALSLHPCHISAYGLIPEEGTPLWDRLARKEYSLPDPELEREMYDLALRKLAENGLQQYEISNFALPGFECRHNIGYWTQVPYLGLGLSAASMEIRQKNTAGLSCRRRTNPDTLEKYLQMVYGGQENFSLESVSPEESRFESVMLSLRMNRGIRPEFFMDLHGVSIETCYGDVLHRMQHCGLMEFSDGTWRLTRRGMDIQNSVLVEFMDSSEKSS